MSATLEDRHQWDLAVVGGGILGLATAREWQARYPDAAVAVLEREPGLGAHQTSHNSGVIHAGIYYKPGSLKAKLCSEGRRRLYDFCAEHGIRHEKIGKVIVAVDGRDLSRLDELEERGRANRIPGLRRIGPAEIREFEPHAVGIAGLHSPETGIVDFSEIAHALAGDIRRGGGAVITGVEVRQMHRRNGSTILCHQSGDLKANTVVACAGAWSDRLATASGASPDPRIVPFRGGYLKLREDRRPLVRSLIYPVPDPALPFLGVHLTRHISGEVLLGPTALLAPARDAYSLRTMRGKDLRATLSWPGTWRMMRRWWRTGLDEMRMAGSRRAFVQACARYVPELTIDDIDPAPGLAGVRAQAVARDGKLIDDFVISSAGGAIHVRNAPSPGATSALAIARLIVDQAAGGGAGG